MIKITYQYNSLARHSIPGLISKRFISKILIADKEYQTDSSFNIPDSIITKISTQLHTIPNHPLSLLNKKIHSFFTKNYSNEFTFIDNLTNPVVTKYQNFDSLLFPTNHPGKAVSDTYYINENELLRTHTSAHQHQTLSNGLKSFLLTAAVYRRDQIDASHYPIFHQMEGVRLFKDKKDLQLRMTTERQSISDTREANKSETLDIAMNPIQSCHLKNEDIIADLSVDLRRCLENLFVYLFANHKDLKFRWIQGYVTPIHVFIFLIIH